MEWKTEKDVWGFTQCSYSNKLYVYRAFYNTRLSQSSFTKNPGLRPPQSKPRATVARKNSLTNRKKSWAEPSSEGEPICFWPALGKEFFLSYFLSSDFIPFSPNLVTNHTPISSITSPCYLDPPHTPRPWWPQLGSSDPESDAPSPSRILSSV